VKNFKVYLHFHKTTLMPNWVFSICLAALFHFTQGIPLPYGFAVFSVSFGFLLSLLIKESAFSDKTEYYFYYNLGIPKTKLFMFSFILNIVLGAILSAGYAYGR